MLHCPHPDHKDDTPSVKLNQDWWYCHGCGQTGDGYRLLALLTGQSLKSVLQRYQRNDGRKPSREVVKAVGPQALQQRVQREWSSLNRDIFERLHDVFGMWHDDVLFAEMDRMGERLDDIKSWMESSLDYLGEDEPPLVQIRKRLDAVRAEEMKYLEEQDRRLNLGQYRLPDRREEP